MCLMNMKEKGWGETQKYLRKSYYHRIKFIVTTFLTAFMWRRHLNSKTLATTIHRKPGEVSDGIGTQVISQTIDKCRVKMIQRELYNVKNPPWKRIEKNSSEKDNKLINNCTQLESIYMKAKLLILRVFSYLFLKFNSNLFWTCDNCCPNSLRPSFSTHSLQIYCLGLIGPLYYTFGPQIETLHYVFDY